MWTARTLVGRHFHGAIALLVALGAAACAPDTSREQDRLLRRGREAFVAGDFERAGDIFRLAAAQNPDDHEAALGVARSHHQLHQYDAALTSYQEALGLGSGDALTWQNYIEALYAGGVLDGNGERLETVLELAPAALLRVPNSVETYEHVAGTAAELNRFEDYVRILEGVADALPEEPVPHIELAKARLEEARRALNMSRGSSAFEALAAGVEELERALRADIEATAASAGADAGASPALYYKLAVGYDLLGEPERAEEWLEALEGSVQGRRMAASMRYEEFLREWISTFDSDAATRIEVTDRWLPRFEPEWANDGTRYRAILGMQLDVMIVAARDALATAGNPDEPGESAAEGVAVSEQQADRLARVGRELARTDTWRGAARFVETASVLARIPSHYVTAVRVTDDGIKALRESRPGLLHPSTHEDDREEIELRYIAVLMQLQGQALHNLGRGVEAEEVLREAIALYPVAASYAVLGGLLLDQDRDAEAFDLFVAALARGFGFTEAALEEQTRASALEAAERVGASPEVVEQAVAFAAELVEEERDLEIVADPLELPAPDFELGDTAGGTWRLSDLAGKVVVLNYWATWCGPCIAEMLYYQSLVEEYSDATDVVFLAISTDSDSAVVAPFIDQNGYTFHVLFDQGSATDFGISGVPASFLIGKDGLIKYRTIGFPGPQPYLHEMRLRIDVLRAAEQ